MSAAPFDSLFLPSDYAGKIPFLPYDDYLVDGQIHKWTGKCETVWSPICRQGGDKIQIGNFLKILVPYNGPAASLARAPSFSFPPFYQRMIRFQKCNIILNLSAVVSRDARHVPDDGREGLPLGARRGAEGLQHWPRRLADHARTPASY